MPANDQPLPCTFPNSASVSLVLIINDQTIVLPTLLIPSVFLILWLATRARQATTRDALTPVTAGDCGVTLSPFMLTLLLLLPTDSRLCIHHIIILDAAVAV